MNVRFGSKAAAQINSSERLLSGVYRTLATHRSGVFFGPLLVSRAVFFWRFGIMKQPHLQWSLDEVGEHQVHDNQYADAPWGLKLNDVDRPDERTDGVLDRFSEVLEHYLGGLLAEERSDALGLKDVNDNHPDFQVDEGNHETTGIKSTATRMPYFP